MTRDSKLWSNGIIVLSVYWLYILFLIFSYTFIRCRTSKHSTIRLHGSDASIAVTFTLILTRPNKQRKWAACFLVLNSGFAFFVVLFVYVFFSVLYFDLSSRRNAMIRKHDVQYRSVHLLELLCIVAITNKKKWNKKQWVR